MEIIHSFLVHFPIALLTTAGALQLLSSLKPGAGLDRTAFWIQGAGTAALLPAVGSGLLTKSAVSLPPPAFPVLAIHEQLALAVTGIFAFLYIWRLSRRGALPTGGQGLLFAALYLAGVLLMWLGAWNGGELAHRFPLAPA